MLQNMNLHKKSHFFPTKICAFQKKAVPLHTFCGILFVAHLGKSITEQ